MRIFIFIMVLLFSGCSNLGITGSRDGNVPWMKEKDLRRRRNFLHIGDIIVKSRVPSSITSWFGHAGIVISPWTIGEYPMIGAGFVEFPIRLWLSEDRNVAVLRYRHMDRKFLRKLILNVKRYSNRKYRITFNKYNSREFYCSQYIWFLYYQTAKEVNDKNFPYGFKKNDRLILPYDLLELPEFDFIELKDPVIPQAYESDQVMENYAL